MPVESVSARRILIFGAGAVGGYLGAMLSAFGHEVILLGRPQVVEAIQRRGLTLLRPEGLELTTQPRAVPDLDAVDSEVDAIFLTVKAHDTEAAIHALQRKGWRSPLLFCWQNGVDGEAQLAAAFGADRVVAGTLTQPVSIVAPGVVRLERTRGGLGLAPMAPGQDLREWQAILRLAGFSTRLYPDPRAMKWSKLLLNLIANATCAILDWPTERVLRDPRTFAVERAAFREALVVMRALGLRPVSLPGYPVPLLAWAMRWGPAPLIRPILASIGARGRGEKPPSLHQDLQRGARLELEAYCGAVVRHGAQAGVPTPVHAALTRILEDLARGREDRAAWHDNVTALLERTGDRLAAQEPRKT
ncbi:ketopantoate reductase family protein [Thermoflexus sp.]|uniref:ketopantoate reductase family protein n=2 Tax=Thermoflexus sp. TaxID=1969742 RepID=UPI0025E33BE9|nr:2-dehydropantoate 2-reductase [Thermoflexus sp.]MDW8181630.1 2-dehydropantoate 2-reductase [Anaerolineae bacterium]MCS6962559.1 2-dehydropantoate 2-reductase [Thermoflexus sp.]MCS7352169.1 2-dehydropantoate 2-reductase [Thermoflexus sp.]MCX7690101.1 2-dehydropantoate 2-reductase [Thermoflexus sp.]MDW8184682.1 2-dehydropantoate 2-reductase [Anaerolineae bacterium]